MKTAKEIKEIFKEIKKKTELQFIKIGDYESVMPKDYLKFNEGMEEKRYYEGYARGRLDTLEWIKDKSGLVSGKGFDIEEEIAELKELLGEKE